jgi:ribosomal protein S18 acetylase RimI-like enzyme
MELTSAPLTPADAGEVLTLQRAAYATEAQLYGDPFLPALTQPLDDLRAELAGPGRGIRDESGRLVAAVRWTVDGETARIGRLTVAPDQQGQGLGTRLLHEAMLESGCTVFELFTGHLSAANIRLYERMGFVEFRRQQLRAGVELVFLRNSPFD